MRILQKSYIVLVFYLFLLFYYIFLYCNYIYYYYYYFVIFIFIVSQGGFAKCYEITELKSNQVFAGKIVPKSLMAKSNQREKMTQEITIHRSLKHKHIVGFHGFFDDAQNVYIILELCRKRVGSNIYFIISQLCTKVLQIKTLNILVNDGIT